MCIWYWYQAREAGNNRLLGSCILTWWHIHYICTQTWNDITLTLQRCIYHILPPESDSLLTISPADISTFHSKNFVISLYRLWRDCVKLKLIAQNVWQVHWSAVIMFSSFNVSVHQQTTVSTLTALSFHRKDDTRHHIYSTASHHGTADKYWLFTCFTWVTFLLWLPHVNMFLIAPQSTHPSHTLVQGNRSLSTTTGQLPWTTVESYGPGGGLLMTHSLSPWTIWLHIPLEQ